MRVLHIGKWDQNGGAAIAGWRIHESLLAAGVASRMLVGTKVTDDPAVQEIEPTPGETLLGKLGWQLGLNNLSRYRSFGLIHHDWFQWADVIHFNNLHNDYFSYWSLPTLAKHKPLFWTHHDMWAITGHCSYSFDCERWKQSCGKCPYPDTYPMIVRDNTQLELSLKQHVYQKTKITCITPSHWLGDQLSQGILEHQNRTVIRYPVDTQQYAPIDKKEARTQLGIKTNKLVLLGVSHSFLDKRKGGSVLLEALQGLNNEEKEGILLLLMGGDIPDTNIENLEIQSLGYVRNAATKQMVYSSADALLFTSMQDNLPLVIQESLCCGTPVVANDAGGCGEMVIDGVSGFLVNQLKANEFKTTIQTLLQEKTSLHQMSASARKFAVEAYDKKLIANQYLQLFQNGMSKRSRLV